MKHHCTYVWADNKKMKKKPVVINLLYTMKVFSYFKKCSE